MSTIQNIQISEIAEVRLGFKVLPGYLAALLNSQFAKSALAEIGGGTNILSIRKSESEAFRLPLPDLATPSEIADLASFHLREINLLRELIIEKQSLYNGVFCGTTNHKLKCL